MEATSGSTSYELKTITQFCQEHQAFTPGGLRWMIFNEERNGLKDSGAIVRIGRRVLIDRPKFFGWVQSQQSKG